MQVEGEERLLCLSAWGNKYPGLLGEILCKVIVGNKEVQLCLQSSWLGFL